MAVEQRAQWAADGEAGGSPYLALAARLRELCAYLDIAGRAEQRAEQLAGAGRAEERADLAERFDVVAAAHASGNENSAAHALAARLRELAARLRAAEES